MFGKKNVVLTAASCRLMEMIRQMFEVLTGERTCFVHIDFNTRQGRVLVGEKETDFFFHAYSSDITEIDVGSECYVGKFDSGQVIVSNFSCLKDNILSTIAGDISMQWVGESATIRREAPIYPQRVALLAKVHGLTVEELLNSKPS